VLQIEPAFGRELPIRFGNGVEVNAELHCKPPDRRERCAGSELAVDQQKTHIVGDLPDSGHAGFRIEADCDARVHCCTVVCTVYINTVQLVKRAGRFACSAHYAVFLFVLRNSSEAEHSVDAARKDAAQINDRVENLVEEIL